jgi:hypothetical protein
VVVLPSDAVVQILAVMIEVLHASVTRTAMETLLLHVQIAFLADYEFVAMLVLHVDAQQDIVNRVRASEVAVVHEEKDKEDVGSRQHDPEDRRLLLVYGGCDEHIVEYLHHQEEDDRQDLLP